MIMESVMDFSSTNSERSSNASSPRGASSPAVGSMKPPALSSGPGAGAGSPPLTPPRNCTPTNNNNTINNNNNNNNTTTNKEHVGLERSSPQHGGGGGGGTPHRVAVSPMEGHPLLQGPPHHMSHSAIMSQRMHLGPPGLGLFNSLMQHASPLDFMAAAHQQAAAAAAASREQQGPPRSYNSPPPISSTDPTANECKLVTYRGQKVAAFIINGDTMLCLPQAFELFLKHLVGGLHTVYTKLKRLDIVPIVCNVEQVRILRGLGAIQPGVNRCKLLSCKDFDALYKDCTTARCLMSQRTPDSSRPGRPTKRVPMGLTLPSSLQGHPQLKKHRLENGDFQPFENGHLAGNEKSPLLANGYNAPPSHLQAMQQLYHHPLLSPAGLGPPPPPQHGSQHPSGHPGSGSGGGAGGPHPGSQQHPALHPALRRPDLPGGLKPPTGMPGMEAIANWENCRAAYEGIVKQLERIQQECGEAEAMDGRVRDLSSHNGSPNGHSPVLNLSKDIGGSGASGGSGGSAVEHSDSDPGMSDKDDDDDDLNSLPDDDEDDIPRATDLSDPQSTRPTGSPMAGSPPPYSASAAAGPLGASGVGSAAMDLGLSAADEDSGSGTTALLRKIQCLLKVAAETARAQERQVDIEKTELKMDVLREREVKQSLERQLLDETRSRVVWQKRLQKERKARRRLQEQLELEMKRRAQLEDALRTAIGNESLATELDTVRKQKQEQQTPHAPPQQDEQQHKPSTSPQPSQHHQHSQQQKQSSPTLDREATSPLLDSRSGYYKNSVLFSGAS